VRDGGQRSVRRYSDLSSVGVHAVWITVLAVRIMFSARPYLNLSSVGAHAF